MEQTVLGVGLLLKLYELRTKPTLWRARAKLRPFLAEIRAAMKYSDHLVNVDKVGTYGTDADSRIATFWKERRSDHSRMTAVRNSVRNSSFATWLGSLR